MSELIIPGLFGSMAMGLIMAMIIQKKFNDISASLWATCSSVIYLLVIILYMLFFYI